MPGSVGRQAIAAEEMSRVTDDLVRRAQDGDVGAFESLYRRHVRRVYGVCLRMTANVAMAEELTQEAFVRAWEKLHLFRGERLFEPWLVTLTANVVRSSWRAKGRRDAHEQSWAEPEVMAGGHEPSAGEAMDLTRAMAQLPPRARQVFVLHDVEGFRHEEIGELLEIAVGTSKAQLHRARRILREALTS